MRPPCSMTTATQSRAAASPAAPAPRQRAWPRQWIHASWAAPPSRTSGAHLSHGAVRNDLSPLVRRPQEMLATDSDSRPTCAAPIALASVSAAFCACGRGRWGADDEEQRLPAPRRPRGDWASEAAEPMEGRRRRPRGGASEGIFGLHRDDDRRRPRGDNSGWFAGGCAPASDSSLRCLCRAPNRRELLACTHERDSGAGGRGVLKVGTSCQVDKGLLFLVQESVASRPRRRLRWGRRRLWQRRQWRF